MNGDDRLIFRINLAQQKLRAHCNQVLREQGIEVTLGQSGILFLLRRQDGQTMGQLSQALAVKNPTLTGLVDRLERSALVTRQASQDDRRAIRIYITPKGIEESDKAKTVIQRVNQEIKAGFSEDEIEAFKRVLNGIMAKFDQS
ncbi:MAG: MarR family transcriptional regulator [Proteobacteria bacterium]|nr:MarR family transcriptional regulator [Pseudomonadota bacterium]MBU1740682.1 MarR family transcriptional regulator [Pseudomonadota bacterium]